MVAWGQQTSKIRKFIALAARRAVRSSRCALQNTLKRVASIDLLKSLNANIPMTCGAFSALEGQEMGRASAQRKVANI